MLAVNLSTPHYVIQTVLLDELIIAYLLVYVKKKKLVDLCGFQSVELNIDFIFAVNDQIMI